MGFMDAVKSVYSNYFNFQGRARRSEYWFFYLFAVIVSVVALILIVSTGETGAGIFGRVYGVFILGALIPQLAVAVRRLHDTDRSGWWLLIGLIPLVGFIVLLIFMVGDSKPGANKYGPNPKGA